MASNDPGIAFSCPICFEDFAQVIPKSLPKCGHSLCSECVSKLQSPNSKLLCPNCRVENFIPLVLPTNFALRSAAESYRQEAWSGPPLEPDFLDRGLCCNCRRNVLNEELWACATCDPTVSLCSTCAMRAHRNHEVNEWRCPVPTQHNPLPSNSSSPKIILIGGQNLADSVQLYYPEDSSRNRLLQTHLTISRAGHVAARLGSQIIIAGGERGRPGASCERTDASLQNWNPAPRMSCSRVFGCGLAFRDRFLVFGGDRDCKGKSSSEIFYPEINKWVSIGRPSTKLPYEGTCCACLGEKIYILGGTTAPCDTIENCALMFDPIAGQWLSNGPEMRCRRIEAAAAVFNSSIIVAGGRNYEGKMLIACEMLDPRQGSWISTCPMLEARSQHQLVECGGKLLALGGCRVKSVEEFEARMNKWIKAEPLVCDTWAAACVML